MAYDDDEIAAILRAIDTAGFAPLVLMPGDLADGVASVVLAGGRVAQETYTNGVRPTIVETVAEMVVGAGGDIPLLPGDVPARVQQVEIVGDRLYTMDDPVRPIEPPGFVRIVGASPNRSAVLVTRTATITLSLPGDDPDAVQVGDGFVSYWRTAGPFAGERVDVITRPVRWPPGTTAVEFVPATGQSNSNGGFNTPVYSNKPVRPGRALSFAGGARISSTEHGGAPAPLRFESLNGLVDLREQPDPVLFGPPGETPMSGVGYVLTDPVNGVPATTVVLAATVGIGGRPITDLNKGTRYYLNLLSAVQQAQVYALLSGLTFKTLRVYSIHGSSNAGNAEFYNNYVQMQADLDADIRAITGQAETVVCIGCQSSAWGAQGQPLRDETMGVMLRAALDFPNRFICTGPTYSYPYFDRLHMNGPGTRANGEAMGRADLRKRAGVAQSCLYGASAQRAGTVVTVQMAGAEGALALDTSVVSDPGNFGIEFFQTGGNAVAITAVSVAGTTMTVTLSAEPTGADPRIDFGLTTTRLAPGGPTTGPRTCLRDAAGKYACHQSLPIT